ncbi:efflux RND transporter periplasmic adaptor subunit [Desulfococcus sp.]|uniref:efflux RND transporter periplasmic adaptor subunit n=1 Tax=Desulfococcus sp. TaxID=2025834 RepID=UPI0035938FD9
MKSIGARLLAVLLIGAAAALGWMIFSRIQEQGASSARNEAADPTPVSAAPITRGPIALRRTFSGTLAAHAMFVAAPKVSGRIERMLVDLADPVRRGQVVAELDDGEYIQAVAEARADLAVARATLAEAGSALEIATRELRRIETLLKRGVASDAQMDTAKAGRLAKQAQLEVASAQVTRAQASLEAANIRLGYTRMTAEWSGPDPARVVAERHAGEGDTVSANTPLLTIVDLDPITAVIYVTEKDYASLRPGEAVSLTTDAYPDEAFSGRIDRIAPVFREATRQARVELTVENARQRLKPGMFIRATAVLESLADAVIVPDRALTTRDGRSGVFVVSGDGRSVAWRTVTVGIREGERVQVTGEGLSGRVVTLGQHLLEDGAAVTIADGITGPAAAGEEAGRP